MMRHLQGMIFAACCIMALGRFTVQGHGLSYAGTFEAISHILVGMILSVCCFNPFQMAKRHYRLRGDAAYDFDFVAEEYDKTRKFAFVCLLLVSLLELVMALNVPKVGGI